MSDAWTRHGGGLRAARARYGEGPWIDLSTGINPHAWPGADRIAIDWHRLPEDADLAALEATAARFFGTDPEYVCAVPGSEMGLRLVADLLPGPAVYVAPGYGSYAELFAEAEPIPAHDLARAEGRTLLLANPNNPDGRSWSATDVRALLDARGKDWTLIDEAFVDTMPEASLAGAVGSGRLILFRSFGKFFGLAGVRLGFVLGPPHLLRALRGRIGAWPVSAAAIAIGTAAYGDQTWATAMRETLFQEAAALDRVLGRRNLTAIGACPLFRLIEVEDAHALFDRLCRRFILTRPFAYDRRWLRIGLPADAAARDRLERALHD